MATRATGPDRGRGNIHAPRREPRTAFAEPGGGVLAWSCSQHIGGVMSTTGWIILIVVLIILFGGGFGFFRRRG
jgi:hypothetical protein